MDKQQFDHIENSIRQASDDISIPFNETAWEKMEVKLDNEFNKDRRRIGIWWWFSAALLLIAASGIYFYNHSSTKLTGQKSIGQTQTKSIRSFSGVTEKNIDPNLVTDNKNNRNKAAQSSDSTQIGGASSYARIDNKPATDIRNAEEAKKTVLLKDQPVRSQHKNIAKIFTPGKIGSIDGFEPGNKSGKYITTKTKKNKTGIITSNQKTLKSEKTAVGNVGKFKNEKSKDPAQINNEITGNLSNNPVDSADKSLSVGTPVLDSSEKIVASDSKINAPTVKTDSLQRIDSVSKKAVVIKLDNRTPKGFYFTASVAADATGVKDLITTKEMKPVYGVGIGYRFNKRFSLQTGFYAGNKVYSAGPDDYYTKPGSYIAQIISAEAQCYIYDIPLTVRYDLLKQNKSNVYLGSGLSTYILKREYYDMHFLNPTGAYHHMSYTYKHNTSYFSILDFSIGYERKISDAFYIQAEPYVKVPLSGVGEGSVKLYSVGLQLGVKYQPFHKKK